MPEELTTPFSPIEVDSSREAVAVAREQIGHFVNYAEQLRMGEPTHGIFLNMAQNIASRPDGIHVFAASDHGDARFIHVNAADLDYPDPSIDTTIAPDAFRIEVVPDLIDGDWTKYFIDNAPQIGIKDIDAGTARELAYSLVIGHELGHGVEKAYAAASPSQPSFAPDIFPTPTYKDLAADVLSQKRSEVQEVPAAPNLSRRIESERIAEGLGIGFAVHRMIQLGLLPDDPTSVQQAWSVLSTRVRNGDRYANAVVAVQQTSPEAGKAALDKALAEGGTTINHIGYGMPHTPQELQSILELTR